MQCGVSEVGLEAGFETPHWAHIVLTPRGVLEKVHPYGPQLQEPTTMIAQKSGQYGENRPIDVP